MDKIIKMIYFFLFYDADALFSNVQIFPFHAMHLAK